MRLALALCLLAVPAFAQERIPSHCIAIAAAEPTVVPVALQDGLGKDSVLIRYLDHASFAIDRSPRRGSCFRSRLPVALSLRVPLFGARGSVGKRNSNALVYLGSDSRAR